ncbi:protein EFFECTOR OF TRANSCRIPTION 2-like isoform X2 [Prosopis cineraria]|uniref:protein EFFECTOR OF TRANSCRIPTION 2-like isoform X2 n=1 Tax=Prosopis cineraria TaxID=364024 RepID=UPI002410375E|nr:protein EFFECTOR OF TRANSCRIPTION 2-like isoform X2 [Prosopis cineraria]
MVAGGFSSVVPRLKREECKRTKHDSNFSDWKILIGPSDWEDYSRGKEGSARYRIHNLPEESSPGVYELGIAVSPIGLGRNVHKLHPNRIVGVYLGKADNVRTRLQQYGRTGAHLSKNCLTSDPHNNPASIHKGQGFFEEIFSQGYAISYRWAPMQNVEDARKTECQFLWRYDYAWNARNNGIRRPDDILQEINKVVSGPPTFSSMTKLLQPFTQKQVGIRIKSSSMPWPDGKLHEIDTGNYNFLPGVFKFSRSNPRLVQDVPAIIEENTTTRFCGVVLSDGSVCRRPPAERRMRCVEHKGMRINGPASKRTVKSENLLSLEPSVQFQQKSEGYVKHPQKIAVEDPFYGSIANICGIILNDGTRCRRPPVEGRQRCHEHKGKRIDVSMYASATIVKPQFLQNVASESDYVKIPKNFTVESSLDQRITSICGIILKNGSPCRRPPVRGRKRCHEHKGNRIDASTYTSATIVNSQFLQNVASESDYVKIPKKFTVESYLDQRITSICGIILKNGSPCRRPPVKGRKRCLEHKGKRI